VGLTNDCLTGGQDATHPCTPGGSGPCIDGALAAVISVNLNPLTTGASTNTAAAGLFCSGQGFAGCFGQAGCRSITETGDPAGPVITGVPADATLATAQFCIPATGLGPVDTVAGLPGPGAVSLPGTFVASP
jgi:hypothetical protein